MSNAPSSFDRYSFVLLMRPEHPTDYPEDHLAKIQDEHLGYLNELGARGVLKVAGPFSEQADERLRGLCVLAVEPDEARSLMEDDPAVRAGRLEVQVMRWWTAEGALAFPLVDGDVG